MNSTVLSTFLFAISLGVLGASASKAHAGAYISYPDFVLMGQDQRRQVVELVQDFVVESEQQGKYIEALASKKARYSFIENLLEFGPIEKAHAYQGGKHGAACMYAGWPSVVEEQKGNFICNNPRHYWKSVDRYKNNPEGDASYLETLLASQKAFTGIQAKGTIPITFSVDETKNLQISIDSDAKCESAKGAVVCNPLIFGRLDEKPFCVAARSDKHGYNASFLCERAVDKISKENPDTYKKLMDGIITEAMKSRENRAFFLNTLKDMYDMCLCSQDKDENGGFKNGRISKTYADRMFYTRTCAGILYQSKSIMDHVKANEESSCSVFSEPIEDNQNWVHFVQEAYKNIKIETDNLSRDYIRYLEIDRIAAREEEQNYITQKRNGAREQRGGSFCPVEMEIPVEPEPEPKVEPEQPIKECSIAASALDKDPNTVKVSFTPAEGTEFEAYSFSPLLELSPAEDGNGFEGIFAMSEAKPDANTQATAKAEPLQEAPPQDTDIKSSVLSALDGGPTPGSEPEEQAPTKKKASNSIKFSALIDGKAACSVTYTKPAPKPKKEKEKPKKIKCDLALSQEGAEGGVNIIAKVKADGKEISKGEDGYSVRFINKSLSAEEESDSDTNKNEEVLTDSDDEMVGEEPKQESAPEEKKEAIEGREIASLEDGEDFAAFVEQTEDEQEILALLEGPEGSSCEVSKTLKVAALKKTVPRGNMQLKSPNLMQMRKRNGGKLMKGNR